MKVYEAMWHTTLYRCESCHALVRVLRELGVTSFLVAAACVTYERSESLVSLCDVIVWEEEVEE